MKYDAGLEKSLLCVCKRKRAPKKLTQAMLKLFLAITALCASAHAFTYSHSISTPGWKRTLAQSGRRCPKIVRIFALEGSEQISKKAEARKLAEDAKKALMEAEAAERKVKLTIDDSLACNVPENA
jgi:hypothetical protein